MNSSAPKNDVADSRSRFRIGLRLFYLLCVAASLVLAFVGIRWNMPRDAGFDFDEWVTQTFDVEGQVVHADFDEVAGDFYRPITNADLRRLSSMTQLESLTVHSSHITDEGLVPLVHLKKLKHFKLIAPNVSGAVLKDIAELRELRTLDIGLTAIKPHDLGALASLPKLTALVVPERFDDESLADLRESMPNCTIRRKWRDF